ncbi:hypothetical protein ACQJBY_049677 [Aegilops geniculata]
MARNVNTSKPHAPKPRLANKGRPFKIPPVASPEILVLPFPFRLPLPRPAASLLPHRVEIPNPTLHRRPPAGHDDAHDLLLGHVRDDPVRRLAHVRVDGLPPLPPGALPRRRLLPVPRGLPDPRQAPRRRQGGPPPPARRLRRAGPAARAGLRRLLGRALAGAGGHGGALRGQRGDRVPPHARRHVVQRRGIHRRGARARGRVPRVPQRRRGRGRPRRGRQPLRLRLGNRTRGGRRLAPRCDDYLMLYNAGGVIRWCTN